MALFHYTAVREGTKSTFSGDREAPDKHALVEALRAEGSIALLVEQLQGTARIRGLNMNLAIPFLSGVKSSDKIIFARNLAAMIKAGLPLARAIAILARQAKGKMLREVIDKVEDELRQGTPLHAALARHPKVFSKLFIAMARAGEASGTLADSLMTAAIQMEKNYALRKKVRGAMIYPSIVLVVMVGVFALMLVYVVPQLSSTFSSMGSKLPTMTRIVLNGSDFVLTHSVLILGSLVAGVTGFVVALRTRRGKVAWDIVVLKTPIIGRIATKANCARTARTLASLLRAGVSPLIALDITQDAVPNTQFRRVIASARDSVEKGKPLSASFLEASNIYPPMFSEMAAVGEETGDVPSMLARVAEFYEEEVEEETKDISTIIEPILMVVIGGGVGFFAIAMIAPIYSISSSV
jgi:type IV pilus assembly protein PilC